ncbi:MAG: tetratricopeptide repeat protein [Candidatus Melainabacteria bacterium]|nr:tetratricopeptide repeat protein [Candidatus Melainabacteria bacterium]
MKTFVTNLILLTLLLSATPSNAADKTPGSKDSASKEEIVRVIMEADDRFSEGEYSSAETLYKRLTIIAPKNREGFLGLGRIEFLRGDSKQALAHFKQAVAVSPQSAPAHFELGSTLLSIGKLNDALKELMLADELDPRRPEIQYRLSQARSLVDASRLTPRSGTVKVPERLFGLRGGGSRPPVAQPGSATTPPSDASATPSQTTSSGTTSAPGAAETPPSVSTTTPSPSDPPASVPPSTSSATPSASDASATPSQSTASAIPSGAPSTPEPLSVLTGSVKGAAAPSTTLKPGTIAPPAPISSSPKNPQTALKDPTALPTGMDNLDIDQTSEVSLVYRLITSGRVEETMAQGLQALKQQPDNASLRYQIGLMYKVRGEIEKAIETFEQTLKYDHTHTQSLSQLTELFISRHEMEKAKATATRWVAADPDNPNAHFSLAWNHVVEREFKDALPHMRAAAQLDPRNTDLLNHLGLVLRELGDDQQAAVYFQRALVLAPASPAPRLNLAMIDLYDQRNPEARELIKPLLANPTVTPHVRSVEALIDAREGRTAEAEKKANEVIKNVPQSTIASLALAVVARDQGRLDEAATILETSYKRNDKNALVIHGLAEVYLAQGKTDKAIEFAKIAHERSPNKFLIAKTLALSLAKSNNTVVALETIKKMRELGDDPDKLFLLEANILDAANDRDGALKHYLALAEKQPDNNDVALKIAHLYFIDRKFKNAELVIDAVLSRAEEHNQARLLKAQILYELKDYKTSLRQVQLVKPDQDLDYETECLTARASFKLRRYSEAAQLFKCAREKQPLKTDDLVMLARALRETDAAAEADQILSEMKSVKFQTKRNQG